MAKAKSELDLEVEMEIVEVDKKDCTNPFNKGVTYTEFLNAIGEKTVSEVLKDKCSDDEIKWIEKELEILNNKK